MAGGGVLATMRPMNERSFHCVDAIAAVNCTLQAAVGRFYRLLNEEEDPQRV
jgi:hypothetical protein